MLKNNKAINIFIASLCSFSIGFLLSKCTIKPDIVEVEKPVEIIKEVKVEVPVETVVEKVVYRDAIPETLTDKKTVITSDEMTEEKGNEILKESDIYCYYVINRKGDVRLRKHFRQGEKFYKFEICGLMPIIYSSEELK